MRRALGGGMQRASMAVSKVFEAWGALTLDDDDDITPFATWKAG
jgi:hypothetical protein